MLGILERKVPSRHVPADGKHLLRGELQSPGKKHDDGFLPVSERKVRVVDLITGILLPVARVVLPAEDGRLVDVRLARVMEQGAQDDALDGKLLLQFGVPLDELLSDHHGRIVYVEGVFQQTTLAAEVEPGGSGGLEEPQFLKLRDDQLDTVPFCGTEQFDKSVLVHIVHFRLQR